MYGLSAALLKKRGETIENVHLPFRTFKTSASEIDIHMEVETRWPVFFAHLFPQSEGFPSWMDHVWPRAATEIRESIRHLLSGMEIASWYDVALSKKMFDLYVKGEEKLEADCLALFDRSEVVFLSLEEEVVDARLWRKSRQYQLELEWSIAFPLDPVRLSRGRFGVAMRKFEAIEGASLLRNIMGRYVDRCITTQVNQGERIRENHTATDFGEY